MTNAAAMVVTTVSTLSQEYADMASKGKMLKDRIAADTKELKGIDKVFKGLFDQTGQRTFLRPDGEVAVLVEHGERHIVDQGKLQADHPEVAKACDKLSEWESPKYKK